MAKSEDVWTEGDVELLRSSYENLSWEALSKRFDRPKEAIRAKANRLGMTRGKTRGWSESEDEDLKRVFLDVSPAEAEVLFGRSWVAISLHARSLGLSRSEMWTDEELDYVRKNYSKKTWGEMEAVLGRSTRAIQHVAHVLGVRKRGRREVVSVFGAGGTLKKVGGRPLKGDWNVPSRELAYVLGCLCSDVALYSSGFQMAIHPYDSLFGDEFARCVAKVFGIVPRIAMKGGSWTYKGERKYGEYYAVGAFSVLLLPAMGTAEGIACGNVRGPRGEWVEFLDRNFSWVWMNDWFGSFMGGLFDGDGGWHNSSVNISIKPPVSQKRIADELRRREFVVFCDAARVYVNGGFGERARFLELAKGVLERKRSDENLYVEKETVRVDGEAAAEFLKEHHVYLKVLPPGCTSYAYLIGGVMKAVGSFSWSECEGGLKGLEFRRFAKVPGGEVLSSEAMAGVLRACVEEHGGLDFIKTFVDPDQGFGTVHQATGAMYLGAGREEPVWVSPSGKEYGGRFCDKKLEDDGVRREDCVVKLVRGKHKYVYVYSDRAREHYKRIEQAYPKAKA